MTSFTSITQVILEAVACVKPEKAGTMPIMFLIVFIVIMSIFFWASPCLCPNAGRNDGYSRIDSNSDAYLNSLLVSQAMYDTSHHHGGCHC